MPKYTVALLRPQRFLTQEFLGFEGQCDLGYLAQVEAGGIAQAIALARKEVCRADRRDTKQEAKERHFEPVETKEYHLLWVFAGHVSAIAYGFEE